MAAWAWTLIAIGIVVAVAADDIARATVSAQATASPRATAPSPPAGTSVYAEEAGRLNSGLTAPSDGTGEDMQDLARPTL